MIQTLGTRLRPTGPINCLRTCQDRLYQSLLYTIVFSPVYEQYINTQYFDC